MFKIAIFASGNGTNAEKIIEYFKSSATIKVDLVVCNRKEAGVFDVADRHEVESLYFPKKEFDLSSELLIENLQKREVGLLVLAGFLLKMPELIVKRFPDRIINIHPALLPDFGGKGMYGDHVHRAVLESGRSETGITIHFVDEEYDHGRTILQETIKIEDGDDLDSIKLKIRKLEHHHFPRVIENLINTIDN